MKIEIYFDDERKPRQVLKAPSKFELDTTQFEDGMHKVILKSVDGDEIKSVREFNFEVKNGPEITLHGMADGDTITGKVELTANAYGSQIGDVFELHSIESPTPVPTWTWVLCLFTLAWSVYYLSQAIHLRNDDVIAVASKDRVANAKVSDSVAGSDWAALGEQVYGNNCASCHQVNGSGVPGVFPSLKGNAVVNDQDPTAQIQTILNGLQGKEIDGVAYATPMPGFPDLSDKEVAAVVNYERLHWGNNGTLISEDDVANLKAGVTPVKAAESQDEAGAQSSSLENNDWSAMGEQVYSNNCASCHQATGLGVPTVFPPLAGNSVVNNIDPKEHILAILNGLQGKEIDGVAYASPMPAFTNLSDEEISAVVNHERTQWGNSARLVSPPDVAKLR